MNKSIKRMMLLCVSFIIAFFTIFSSFQDVFAASDLLRQEELPYYKAVPVNPAYGVFSGKTTRWSWYGIIDPNLTDTGSGESKLSAYCLEIEAPVYAGDRYYNSATWGSLTYTQQMYINYALIFGYGDGATKYGYSWETEYCATQALIWMIVENYYGSPYEGDIVAGLLAQVPNGTACYYQIRNNTTSYQYAPSFASRDYGSAPTISLQYDRTTGQYSTTVYDSNGVLSAFDFSMSGVTFTKNGNYLTITTSNSLTASSTLLGSEQKDLAAASSGTSGVIIDGVPEYWTCSGSQSMVQLEITAESDPVYAYIRLETESPGTLEIDKTSDDGVLAGFQFRVTGNGVDETFTTGDDGILVIGNMPIGTYTVQEVNTPVRYYQPDNQTVTITSNNTSTVSFDNLLYFGGIKITKTSEDGTLEGFQFWVTNELGYDETFTTDENGEINIGDLVPVEYTIQEINTPDMYNQPDDQTVLVQDHGRVTTATFENTIKKGTVSFVKSSRLNGKLLGNSTYGVFAVSDGSLVDTITTSTDGSGSSNIMLLYGKYYLKEIKAPFGYDLDSEMYPFNINVNGEIESLDVSDPPLVGAVTLEYKNDPYTISGQAASPKTGDHILLLPIILIAITGSGIVIMKTIKKREHKDEIK